MYGRHGIHGIGRRARLLSDEGHRRGRGRERGFEHGKLRYVLLKLIAEKPRHGYELIKAIEERTNGVYSPSPGVIYPTLTLLEELGAITLDDSDGQRRLCQITATGRKLLAEQRADIEEVEARLARAGRHAARRDELSAPIVRAMENVRTALRLRLEGAPLNREQVHAIAAALDGAATGIERA